MSKQRRLRERPTVLAEQERNERMLLRSKCRMAGCIALCALITGCGHAPKSFDSVSVKPTVDRESSVRPQELNVTSAASLALRQRQRDVFTFMAVAAAKEKPSLVHLSEPSSTTTPTPVEAATAPSSPWDCIATAERSGHDNPAMGPTYWTEYGVVIDVIQDYGTPAEQAAIFGGYADAATRLAPVARFATKNGFGGWGELTKQKCGL